MGTNYEGYTSFRAHALNSLRLDYVWSSFYIVVIGFSEESGMTYGFLMTHMEL